MLKDLEKRSTDFVELMLRVNEDSAQMIHESLDG